MLFGHNISSLELETMRSTIPVVYTWLLLLQHILIHQSNSFTIQVPYTSSTCFYTCYSCRHCHHTYLSAATESENDAKSSTSNAASSKSNSSTSSSNRKVNPSSSTNMRRHPKNNRMAIQWVVESIEKILQREKNDTNVCCNTIDDDEILLDALYQIVNGKTDDNDIGMRKIYIL